MLARAEYSGAAQPVLVDMVTSQQGAQEFEKPRVRRQARAHTVAADLDQDSARTALQQLSVTVPTQKQYEKILAELGMWISSRKACPQCEEDWDARVAALMYKWFYKGQGANSGEKVLAAVLSKLLQSGRSASDRMSQSRLPLPTAMVPMPATEILWSGHPDIAKLVLLMLETYCRPPKPMPLRVRDVAPGQSKTGMPATAILLAPVERGEPAKNPHSNQRVHLDLPQRMVFSRAPPSLGPSVHERGLQLRTEALGAGHPYRLRHTSAALDLASSARSLERIQKKGPSSSARLSRAFANQGWLVLRSDWLDGPKYNLEFVRNRQLIQEWIRAGHARGWHAGVPCQSFSRTKDRARGPPRSAPFPKGVPDLAPHDLSRVVSLQLSPCRCPWLPQSSWNSLQAQHDSVAPSPTKDGLCYAGTCWTGQSTTWSLSETASSSEDGSEPDMSEGGTQDFLAKVSLEPETDLVDLPDSEAPLTPKACRT